MTDGLIAVTGATGGLGGRVARRLADRGLEQRLVVRDPSRAPELDGATAVPVGGYDDAEGLVAALTGARTLYLVSAKEDADRVSLHTTVVDAALAAGVQRVVYTSFLGAAPDCSFTFGRDHWATEEHVKTTGLDWTFLRDSIYLDFVPFFAGEDGVIRGPAGDGRTAWVARDDVADASVAVLADERHTGEVYELTGPEAHTMAWAAEQLTRCAGRPVRYEDETLEEAYASRGAYDAAQFEIDGWVSSYTAVANGELDVVTDHVAQLSGHAPQDLPGFLQANPDSYAHLRSG